MRFPSPKTLVAAVFCLSLVVTATAQEVVRTGPPAGGRPQTNALPVPVDPSLAPDEIDRRLGGYFSKLAADDVFSGVALVARNGVPVFMQAYGMADREKKIANTIRTRFNIGSINKMFTKLAIQPGMGIAGGAPGTNAVLESRGEWTVIVLTNFDPPTGERLGVMLANALAG